VPRLRKLPPTGQWKKLKQNVSFWKTDGTKLLITADGN
jgi:hypothetical protein